MVADKLLDGSNAPLGTFSSTHHHGLRPRQDRSKYFRALESIREIRNAFAHFRRTLSFEDPEIKVWVESMMFPFILPVPSPDISLMRNRYIYNVNMILGFIASQQEGAKPPRSSAGRIKPSVSWLTSGPSSRSLLSSLRSKTQHPSKGCKPLLKPQEVYAASSGRKFISSSKSHGQAAQDLTPVGKTAIAAGACP